MKWIKTVIVAVIAISVIPIIITITKLTGDNLTGTGGGLTGGYSVVYRSNYNPYISSWISITLTFVDDTTASYEIKQGGSFPSDWEHYTGFNPSGDGYMTNANAGPYVWNNVKSVSITAYTEVGTPYLHINDVNVGATYNETLDKNILVHQSSRTETGGDN